MDIKVSNRHEQVLYAALDRGQLDALILKAVAERSGIALSDLRVHGKVMIEPNMEGSPAYQAGHRAVIRATIPLGILVPEAAE